MDITPIFRREKYPMIMKSNLSLISKTHSLRCDAKQAERRFAEFDEYMSKVNRFYLGDFLPKSIVKGTQPHYIEDPRIVGIPVISTLVIQGLKINIALCRYITEEGYDEIDDERKPFKNDVLLTMDGGTSIGKPVLFDLEDSYAIDSHVAIVRPTGLNPRLFVYLLASPIGKLQFNRAESGASGQTSVTEEDIRRFVFPSIILEKETEVLSMMDNKFQELKELEEILKSKEEQVWDDLMGKYVNR